MGGKHPSPVRKGFTFWFIREGVRHERISNKGTRKIYQIKLDLAKTGSLQPDSAKTDFPFIEYCGWGLGGG